jgi:hypothetical protein
LGNCRLGDVQMVGCLGVTAYLAEREKGVMAKIKQAG